MLKYNSKIVTYKCLEGLTKIMSEEPLFGAYIRSRDDMPDNVDEIYDDEFEFEKVPADKVIRGWDDFQEFLNSSDEEYYWKEAEPENAPKRIICSVCDEATKTHSDQRIEHLRSMHHISTGH